MGAQGSAGMSNSLASLVNEQFSQTINIRNGISSFFAPTLPLILLLYSNFLSMKVEYDRNTRSRQLRFPATLQMGRIE